jgi:hypothetical protein
VQVATDIRDWLEPKLVIVKDYIVQNLIPALASVAVWLGANIPLAIQALKTEWENLKTKWAEFKTYVETKLGPALDTVTKQLGLEQPAAAVKNVNAMDTIKGALQTTAKDAAGLVSVFVALGGWIGRRLPDDIQSSKPGWEGLQESFTKIWTIVSAQLIGPDGVLTKLKDWFTTVVGVIDIFIAGPVADITAAFTEIYNAAKKVYDIIVEMIDKLLYLGNIDIPNIFGSKGRIEIGLEGITKGFLNAASAAGTFKGAMGDLSVDAVGTGGITSFAGAILGRFQQKFTTPLEERVLGLREELDAVNEAYKDDTLSVEEMINLDMRRAEIERQLAATSTELNIQKERELELQKQLNDLAFLQAQMAFVSFMTDNGLDLASILGDLKLGLDLDLPAFMDAITRAIAAMVVTMGGAVNPSGGSIPSDTPQGFGAGKPTGSGVAVYNNNNVNLYFNTTLNNGMDFETFKVGVLQVVTGALG